MSTSGTFTLRILSPGGAPGQVSSEAVHDVLGFQGQEDLGACYAYEILFKSSADASALRSLLNASVILQGVSKEGKIPFFRRRGILSSVEEQGGGFWKARLLPRLARLGMDKGCRIFTGRTLEEILKALLPVESGVDYSLGDVAKLAAKLEMRCQYEESSLDFLDRLCQREGVCYRFLQDPPDVAAPEIPAGATGGVTTEAAGLAAPPSRDSLGEQLCFLDLRGAAAGTAQDGDGKGGGKAEAPPEASVSLAYAPAGGAGFTQEQEHLRSLVWRNPGVPRTLVLQWLDPLRPGKAQAPVTAAVSPEGFGTVTLQGEVCATEEEAESLASRRAAALAWPADLYLGTGEAPSLAPGCLFSVAEAGGAAGSKDGASAVPKGVPAHLKDRSFRVVSCRHMGVALGDGGANDLRVESVVEAIPSGLSFCPALRTPRPRVPGQIHARVLGAEGGEGTYAEPDEHGRHRVLPAFAAGDGHMAFRAPQLQPYGGKDSGSTFPLRRDADVLLVALEGDPDRMVIAGALPTADCPPVVGQDRASHHRIHTGGGNHIDLNDREGSQWVGLHCPSGNTSLLLGARGPGSVLSLPGLYTWTTGIRGESVLGSAMGFVAPADLQVRLGLESRNCLGSSHRMSGPSTFQCTWGYRTDLHLEGDVLELGERRRISCFEQQHILGKAHAGLRSEGRVVLAAGPDAYARSSTLRSLVWASFTPLLKGYQGAMLAASALDLASSLRFWNEPFSDGAPSWLFGLGTLGKLAEMIPYRLENKAHEYRRYFTVDAPGTGIRRSSVVSMKEGAIDLFCGKRSLSEAQEGNMDIAGSLISMSPYHLRLQADHNAHNSPLYKVLHSGREAKPIHGIDLRSGCGALVIAKDAAGFSVLDQPVSVACDYQALVLYSSARIGICRRVVGIRGDRLDLESNASREDDSVGGGICLWARKQDHRVTRIGHFNSDFIVIGSIVDHQKPEIQIETVKEKEIDAVIEQNKYEKKAMVRVAEQDEQEDENGSQEYGTASSVVAGEAEVECGNFEADLDPEKMDRIKKSIEEERLKNPDAASRGEAFRMKNVEYAKRPRRVPRIETALLSFLARRICIGIHKHEEADAARPEKIWSRSDEMTCDAFKSYEVRIGKDLKPRIQIEPGKPILLD